MVRILSYLVDKGHFPCDRVGVESTTASVLHTRELQESPFQLALVVRHPHHRSFTVYFSMEHTTSRVAIPNDPGSSALFSPTVLFLLCALVLPWGLCMSPCTFQSHPEFYPCRNRLHSRYRVTNRCMPYGIRILLHAFRPFSAL